VIGGYEGRAHQALRYECQSVPGSAKVEGRFGEYGFTGKKGLCHLMCNFQSPLVMLVGAIGESY
jgi:hypothetical protein